MSSSYDQSEYLPTLVKNVMILLDNISLDDVCQLRLVSREIRDIVDKRMIIVRDNEDIQVTCGINYRKKIVIRDTIPSNACRIMNPFSDTLFTVGPDHNLGEWITNTVIIERNDSRTIHSVTTMSIDDRVVTITKNIKRIREDHYYGTRSSHDNTMLHYIKITQDNVVCISELDKCLIASSADKVIRYDRQLESFTEVIFPHEVIEDDENCIIQNAVRIVLSMEWKKYINC